MDEKKLKKILKNHGDWLNGNGGTRADLRGADLRGADLTEFDLRLAYLRDAKFDYSFKKKIVSNKMLMNKMFQHTKKYWIAYKSFDENHSPPKKWNIKEKSIIKSIIDTNRFIDCSFGINVGTLEWCKKNCNNQVYKLHIPKTAEYCVPIWTDGKVRVSEAKIIKIIATIII